MHKPLDTEKHHGGAEAVQSWIRIGDQQPLSGSTSIDLGNPVSTLNI